jgi:hypothetical protein
VVTGTLPTITKWEWVRGNIPVEYWDKTLTPNDTQLTIILHLIDTKYFNDNTPHPAVQSDYQFTLDALDSLGDSRWISAGDFIDVLIHFPDLENTK